MTTKVGRFGIMLKAERLKRSLSQEALAELSGLSRNYVSSIERGRVSPSLGTLEKLANALGISLTKLISKYEDSR
jgi:transcriptional regulator with XRE-family HTH domain